MLSDFEELEDYRPKYDGKLVYSCACGCNEFSVCFDGSIECCNCEQAALQVEDIEEYLDIYDE